MIPTTLERFRANIERRRREEQAAFDAWFQSRGQEPGVRESLWAGWIVSRSALDRAVSLLRSETADRERLGRP